MVVIGGVVTNAQHDNLVDPWTKGIGIFDLSEMVWKKTYNANAAPYVTPEFVQLQNDQRPYPSEWSNPVVKVWFTQTQRQQRQSALSSSGNDSQSSNSGGSNVGAIAGGTVGGVVAVALIAALVIVLVRRRRKTNHEDARQGSVLPYEAGGTPRSECTAKELPREVDSVPKSELAAREPPKELDSVPRAELAARDYTAAEVPGS